MKKSYTLQKFPRSRIATFDTFSVGMLKHHVSALLEFDVTDSRKKLQELRRNGQNISFNGWIIKVISNVLKQHPEAAAFLYNKRKLIIFDDINISIAVEKEINGEKVPIPLVIEKTNEKSAIEITSEIEEAKNRELSKSDIVLQKKPAIYERLYYRLPGSLRRAFWKILLRSPKYAFGKMGNVMITSVGMIGRINGWFIHTSVHPLSFGIGSILKKPFVIGNKVEIREVLNMTILVDHDVIDGGQMVRFLKELTRQIENGEELSITKP